MLLIDFINFCYSDGEDLQKTVQNLKEKKKLMLSLSRLRSSRQLSSSTAINSSRLTRNQKTRTSSNFEFKPYPSKRENNTARFKNRRIIKLT